MQASPLPEGGDVPPQTGAGSSPHITKENIDGFNYFQLFGLALPATAAASADAAVDVTAIRRVYRRLSLRFHPDKDDTAEARHAFEVVHTALETVIDPEKRQAYVKSLTETTTSGGGGGGGLSGDDLRQRQRTQQAQEEALWAADALAQREQQRLAKEAAARQAALEREAAAQRLLAELTGTLQTPFKQMEAELVQDWEVDEDMVAMKTKEVMKLLRQLAPERRTESGWEEGSAPTSRKRDRAAAEV